MNGTYSSYKNYIGYILAACSILAIIGYTSSNFVAQTIVPYDAARDRADIIALFEYDKQWLTDVPDHPIEYMLDTKTIAPDSPYKKALQFYVAREKGQFVGFITFFKKRSDLGYILFVSVHPDFRRRGYAKRFVEFAIDECAKMGMKRVALSTRVDNKPAQAVYVSAGFDEIDRDYRYVYYEYLIKKEL